MKTKVLLLGAGHSKVVRFGLVLPGEDKPEYDITSLDFDEESSPDILWDLENIPLRNRPLKFRHLPKWLFPKIPDNSFDEIHAYDVLEHTGTQGDWRFFFDQFADFWRILRPEGKLILTTPAWDAVTAWGDPSHKRVINEISLVFLDQWLYHDQVGRTQMTDYRRYYKADFSFFHNSVDKGTFRAFLQAKKPVRTFSEEES
jgi:hypothetical protein